MSARTFKLIGAAGAAALTVGVMAGPAVAADQVVNYTCNPGPLVVPITFNVGTLPASMTAGQTVKKTITDGNVHLDQNAVGLAQLQMWTHVSGTATGKGASSYKLTIPKTPVPVTPGATLDVPATGAFTLHPTKAGSLAVKAGASTAFIQGYKGATKANSVTLACTPPTDGSNEFGTVSVKKDGSKTVTKASYNARKDVATGTAKVAGSKFKLAGTGKVTFTLKKGSKTVKTLSAKLKKGKATAAFKHVKAKGSYTIIAKFKGDAGLKGSSGKATFKVK